MKNLELLKTVGQTLGREAVVIAVKSFNVTTNKLEGHAIYVFSDHESGITLNSNGVILSGRYNPDKGTNTSINFVLNPKYKMPWTNANNTEVSLKVKELTDKLIANNPCILAKHKAVNMIINNYDEFLDYCVSSGYMKIKQLNHTSTQIKYRERENKKEVAAANNVIPITIKQQMSPMKVAHTMRKKLLTTDESFARLCYSSQMKYCLSVAWIQIKQTTSAASEVSISQVAPKKEKVQEPKKNNQLIKNRVEGYQYVTFEPGKYFIEDCYGNKMNECDKYKEIPLKTGKLKDIEVEWTEKFFVQKILATVPKHYVIVISKKTMVPDDGRIYIKL